MKSAKTTRYRSVGVSFDHPLSQGVSDCGRYGKVYEHRLVLFNKVGPGNQECYWCKKQVFWMKEVHSNAIVADHLDGNEWNNTPENLVVSCRRCNIQRSIRSDFLTHCPKGHIYSVVGLYIRLDGGGRMCKGCNRERAILRTEKRRQGRSS